MVGTGSISEVSRTRKSAQNAGAPNDTSRIIESWNEFCDRAELFRRDPTMKKPRLEIKKQIKLLFNQLTAIEKHVTMKVKTILTTLRNAKAVEGMREKLLPKEKLLNVLLVNQMTV